MTPRAACAGTTALIAALLVVLSQPASGYVTTQGGFSDGSESVSVSVPAGPNDLTGPSLRLLTNGTVLGASLVVMADPGVSNISLRLAGNAQAFFSHAGNLTSGVYVTLDPSQLNAAIAATNGTVPRPQWVDVAILVAAAGPGALTLSSPRVEMRFTNPVLISFDPVPGSTIQADEGGTLQVNWTEVVQEGDLPAGGDWYLDGRWLRKQPPGSPFVLRFNHSVAGNHTLAVALWRDAERINATWPLVVLEVNVPPEAYFPRNWVKRDVSYMESIALTGWLRDDDLDPLNWTWRLDGVLVVENTTSLVLDDYFDGVHVRRVQVTVVLDHIPIGEHRLILRATDGKDAGSDGLTIVSRDYAPYFYESKPVEQEIAIQEGDGLAFDLPVFDRDGDPISRRWYLDDVLFETAQQAFLDAGRLPAGVHHVRVEATSTNHSIELTWTVQVNGRPPPSDPGQEALVQLVGWFLVVVVAAVVGAATAVVMVRRR